ncbi:hypothetical protein BKA56DRAFT_274310 [Ilyonectria sp. MPI-CAGE-AT-0026]|nr:hypothetical protein BKA56DRAFT_274310 [Ilyonectria sp. MPI-CAGE-AT-0026]
MVSWGIYGPLRYVLFTGVLLSFSSILHTHLRHFRTFECLLWLFRDLCDRSYQSCSQVDMRLTSTNAHDVRVN